MTKKMIQFIFFKTSTCPTRYFKPYNIEFIKEEYNIEELWEIFNALNLQPKLEFFEQIDNKDIYYFTHSFKNYYLKKNYR